MSSPAQMPYEDTVVIRYLLGTASDEETERLDELSITDDEFAWRLREMENDLVDSYIRGELAGETLDRFRSFYLSTAARREKVEFAKSFLAALEREPVSVSENAPEVGERRRTSRGAWGWLSWGFAAAACVLAAVSAWLLIDNQRLQNQIARDHAERLRLDQQEQASHKQLAVPADTKTPTPSARPALALVLLPQTRGAGSMPTLAMPPGTDRVAVRLVLESDDFPVYRAVLKDPAANQRIWISGKLKAVSNAGSRAVSFDLSPGLLKPQHYSLDLMGIPSTGQDEVAGSYIFKVTGGSAN